MLSRMRARREAPTTASLGAKADRRLPLRSTRALECTMIFISITYYSYDYSSARVQTRTRSSRAHPRQLRFTPPNLGIPRNRIASGAAEDAESGGGCNVQWCSQALELRRRQ